jgi:hypothetical protein
MTQDKPAVRQELVDQCKSLGLKKTGNMDVLKYRITDHFGREIEDQLNLETFPKNPETDLKNLETAPKSEAEPPLPPPPDPPEAPEEAPADAPEGGEGQSGEQPKPFVFGRQSFAIPGGGEDNTAFFTDAKDGPALKDTNREHQAELVQAGTDGIIPVATLVKVLDGFKGIEDGEKQVAFLLAGRPGGKACMT